jgi:hypothetical protein
MPLFIYRCVTNALSKHSNYISHSVTLLIMLKYVSIYDLQGYQTCNPSLIPHLLLVSSVIVVRVRKAKLSFTRIACSMQFK